MNSIINGLSSYDIKQTGNNRYLARCPVHNEKTPSLMVTILDDGKTIAHCFGCGADGIAVVEALGLTTSDLFPYDDNFNNGEYQQKKQNIFKRAEFMSDYQLIQLGEAQLKNKKPFTVHDKTVFKAAIDRINQYKFNAHEAYAKLIKQDAMDAALNRAYYEWQNNDSKYLERLPI